MELNAVHPVTFALNLIAPIFGANFELKSGRDTQLEAERYPLIDYFIHKEGRSTYERSKKVWRVEIVLQLNYQLEEDGLQECIPSDELEESLGVQGVQFSITGKLRGIVQMLVDPGSLGKSLGVTLKSEDFLWSKYEFKLVDFVESAYFRRKGMQETSGSSSLMVLSFLDIDNVICCVPEDGEAIKNMLDPASTTAQLLDLQLNP